MESNTKVKTPEDKLKDDLVQTLKRLTALQEQRAGLESVMRSLTKEIVGLEAVVKYIREGLKKEVKE